MKKKTQPPTGIAPQSAHGYEPTHVDESIVLEVTAEVPAEVSKEEEAVKGIEPSAFAKPKKSKRVSMTDGGAKQLNEEAAAAPAESDKSEEEVAPVVEEKVEEIAEIAGEEAIVPETPAE